MRPEETKIIPTPTYSVTAENRCNPYITYSIQNLTEKQRALQLKICGLPSAQ